MSSRGIHDKKARTRVRHMTRLLRDLRDDKATREDVEAWTRTIPEDELNGGPFPHHGTANSIFGSIWNTSELHEGEFWVRDIDVAMYVRWLEEGFVPTGNEALLLLKMGMEELAMRVGTPATRVAIEGLGWHEQLRFSSTGTGTPFFADAPHPIMERAASVEICVHPSVPAIDSLQDVFETLEVDLEDTVQVRDDIDISQLPRWRVWRQDDNGNQAMIREVSSEAKATRIAKEFEDRGHKQMYWHELVPPKQNQ